MAGGDPRMADGAERLDELIRSFPSGDYAADGIEHDHGDHGGHGHDGPSVRVFDHRGHRVEIVTRYEVTVDGERWDQHIEVLDDGNVVYHGASPVPGPVGR